MLCELLEVHLDEPAVSTPFVPVSGAERELPPGSLVLSDGACADGSAAVEVLSIPIWYTAALAVPPVGARGCVAAGALGPPEDLFLVQESAWPLQAGEIVTVQGTCDAWTVRGFGLSRDALAALRPVSPRLLADATRVRDAYEAHFGPLNLASVPLSDGFVGLPLPFALDAAAVAEERARERLDTLERQQGTLRWMGGAIDGRTAYAHFLGADSAWSDLWARPDTVIRVLELAAGWARACPRAADAPETCLLQLGDLAWFEDVVPDPLGHKDHHAGRCVDVRLFRDDGSRYEAWWNRPDDRPGVTGGYDQELTLAFLRWASAELPVTTILFGDPAARRQVPLVRPVSSHDEHIHLCF